MLSRIIQIVIALLLLPLLALFTIVLFFLIGYPFFIQTRIGKNNNPFRLYKFKTMSQKRDQRGELLPEKERMLRIGHFLRKTSLDELPQLINLLKGEMNFIGPRPLLPEYLPYYSSYQLKRHKVRPGMSGWAQVNGRNTIPWDKKLELDVWYVEHQSLLLDLKIMVKTIRTVFQWKKINANNQESMIPFDEWSEIITKEKNNQTKHSLHK